MLVKDALFVVRNGEARFVADSPAKLENGGFEQFQGDRINGFKNRTSRGRRPLLTHTSPFR